MTEFTARDLHEKLSLALESPPAVSGGWELPVATNREQLEKRWAATPLYSVHYNLPNLRQNCKRDFSLKYNQFPSFYGWGGPDPPILLHPHGMKAEGQAS